MIADRISLPFHSNPYSVMYHHLAFPLGILQGHTEIDISPWLCDKYINCQFCFKKGSTQRYNIVTEDPWFLRDEIFILQKVLLTSDLRQTLFGSYTEFLLKMINLGCYPNGNYNEALIPCKNTYGMEYYRHDYLLTGYDANTKRFQSVGYVDDFQFRFFDIPFDLMEQALTTLVERIVELCFWKINPAAVFSINIPSIRNELASYLNSSPYPYPPKDGYRYGITAHKYLGKYFSMLSPQNALRDRRYTRGFLEHKFLMHFRLDYLFQQGYIRTYDHVEKARYLYRQATNIHMLGLKFYLKPEQRLLGKMQILVDEITDAEAHYLPLVLAELSDHGDDNV